MPHWFVRLIELFLRDRRFRVHIGDDTSTWRTQANALPQGSVLSPTLFNLYTNDLPVTGSRKFIYADDICLTMQAQRYAELECYLSSHMVRMASYCRLWLLKPSPMKTVTSVFHLLNTSAARELRVHMEGQQLRHDPTKVTKGECHRDWPLYDDVFYPPPLHLESRKPLWRDLQSIDVTSRWREDWQSATVVNSALVTLDMG